MFMTQLVHYKINIARPSAAIFTAIMEFGVAHVFSPRVSL